MSGWESMKSLGPITEVVAFVKKTGVSGFFTVLSFSNSSMCDR